MILSAIEASRVTKVSGATRVLVTVNDVTQMDNVAELRARVFQAHKMGEIGRPGFGS